jgi:hypothetical protein
MRPQTALGIGELAQASGAQRQPSPQTIRRELDVILGQGKGPRLEDSLSLQNAPRTMRLTDRVRYALLERIGSNASEFADPKQPPVAKQAVQLLRLGTSGAAARTAVESVLWRDWLFHSAPDKSGPRPDVDGFIRTNARWLD